MNVHANGIKNRCIKLEKPYWPIEYIRLDLIKCSIAIYNFSVAQIEDKVLNILAFLTLIHIANHAKISCMDQTLQ